LTKLLAVLAVVGLFSCAQEPPPQPVAPPPPAPPPPAAPPGIRVEGISVPCFAAGNPCAILNGVMVNNGNCCSGSCQNGVCK
jgi:hypothetical protein